MREAGRDHLVHAQIEFVAVVSILSLGSEVGDALASEERLVLPLPVDQVQAPLTAGGGGPQSPRNSLSSTVLPAPFGPASSQRWPARTSNETSRSVQWPPRRTLASSMRIAGELPRTSGSSVADQT